MGARPAARVRNSGILTRAIVLLPGNEHLTPPEIAAYRPPAGADGAGWEVRVFPERDPYFVIEEDLVREGIGMFDRISTRGASEIVVESPDHGMTLDSADEAQVERVLWMYRDRVKDLKRDLKIRNVVVTRRHGKPGARIRHPYSAILAAPIVFDDLRSELTQAREYYAYKRRCVFCDTVREEAATGDRMIQVTPHFAAFVPYAARVPSRSGSCPRRHASRVRGHRPRGGGGPRADAEGPGRAPDQGGRGPLLRASRCTPRRTSPSRSCRASGTRSSATTTGTWRSWCTRSARPAVAGIAVTDMLPEEAARILREAGSLDTPRG